MSRSAIVVLLIAGVPRGAASQATAGPPGASGGLFGGHRPIDPSRTSQRLFLSADVSGGYDETPTGEVQAADLDSGGVGNTGGFRLQYWRGRANRFVEASAGSFVDYNRVQSSVLVGGEAALSGSASFGRGWNLTGGGSAAYRPAVVSSALFPVPEEQVEAPTSNATSVNGVMDRTWLNASSWANTRRQWSRRSETSGGYRVSHQRPIEGDGLDSFWHQVTLRHQWNLRPTTGFQLQYLWDQHEQSDQGLPAPPLSMQTVAAGINLERRISPRRVLNLTFMGGTTFTKQSSPVGASYVSPMFAATALMGLTRVWSLAVDARRTPGQLDGLSPEPFSTDAVTVRVSAGPSSRFRVGLTGSYAQGRALESSIGSFDAASASVQAQYGFARCCGAFVNYAYYDHRLRGVLTSSTFPRRYNRDSVRAGFTLWLPLYGTF